MKRRTFVKGTVLAGAAAALPVAGLSCATVARRPDGSPESMPVDQYLAQGARVMWVAPHPDDECISGSLLARASLYYKNPVYMLVLTHGEGGECCRTEGCKPDLATVRGEELRRVAERYNATLQHESFWNVPLPVESFPKRHKIFERWRQQKDPVALVAEAMRRFKPDLLLTFDPDRGATGHPEHQLGARIATAGVRLAAHPGTDLAGLKPHRVGRTYRLLAKHWILSLFGAADPGDITETWDSDLPSGAGMTCREFMAWATRLHRSQDTDMGSVRKYVWLFAPMKMRQVDPFTEIKDPAEPPPA